MSADEPNEISDEEIERRMNQAIKRSLLTPPKPLKERPKLRKKKPTSAASKPASKTE